MAKAQAQGVTAKGITCLELSVRGYSSQEIGQIIKVEAATGRMWMTKARRFLRKLPELREFVCRGWFRHAVNMEKGQTLERSGGFDPLGLCSSSVRVFIGYVPTESMEPTLPRESFICALRIFDEPQVGDIIVFQKDGTLLVKRIAARPGDEIDLSKLTYMTTALIPVWEEPIIAVPEDCFFVLGDNGQDSWDSRYWKNPFVRIEEIVVIIN